MPAWFGLMAIKTHNFLSVEWRDRDLRDDWSTEYVPVGSLPGVIRGISGVGSTGVGSKLLSQTAFLTRRNRRREDVGKHARRVAGLLAKFLQRGVVPLPTLGIERAALEHHGLMDEEDDLSEGGIELGWVARRGGRLADERRLMVSTFGFSAERKSPDSFEYSSWYGSKDAVSRKLIGELAGPRRSGLVGVCGYAYLSQSRFGVDSQGLQSGKPCDLVRALTEPRVNTRMCETRSRGVSVRRHPLEDLTRGRLRC